jgi:hypothetical protein
MVFVSEILNPNYRNCRKLNLNIYVRKQQSTHSRKYRKQKQRTSFPTRQVIFLLANAIPLLTLNII